MIKILTHTPTKHDSTSFYRVHGVLHNLNRQMGGQLQIVPYGQGNYTWAELGGFDILFLHRPAHPVLLKMAEYCKKLGVKVWVDFDDNLFNLPPENRAYWNYKDEVKKAMWATLQLADMVTVSTGALGDFFAEIGITAPIKVIHNALNDDWFTMSEVANLDSNIIGWRGSETHLMDLAEYTAPMLEAIQANEQYTWHFMGHIPVVLTRMVPAERMVFTEPEDPILYFKRLKDVAPLLMHVPLSDNALNQSKSNIAWMEATYAGAVCVAPDWPEWRKPGVINYKDGAHYAEILKNPMPPAELVHHWKQSKEYIEKNLLLSTVNEQRVELIKKLT